MVAGPVGLLLIAAQATGMIFDPVDWSLTTPFPVSLVFPVFFGVPVLGLAAGVFVVPLLTFLFVARFRKEARIFLSILHLTILAASFWWFREHWMDALPWQGLAYIRGAVLLSLLFAMVIGVQLLLDWRQPSRNRLFAVTFLLFAWIYTYAVPYVGEMP